MYKSHFFVLISYPKARGASYIRGTNIVWSKSRTVITNCHPGGLTSMLQPLEWDDLFGESDDEDFEGIV